MSCRVRPVKLSKKGGKSVVEFMLRLQPEGRHQRVSKTIVGELRPDDRGRHVFSLLSELCQNGFDSERGLKVCEPLAYFPDWNLLLRSKAHGRELSSILASDGAVLEHYLTQVAGWVAKLHRTQVDGAQRLTVEDEEKIVQDRLQRLSRAYPRYAANMRHMASRVLESAKTVNTDHLSLIHGDLHPKNIFVNGPNLTVIDFDHTCIFDPAKDLGYFLAEFFVQLAIRRKAYELGVDAGRLRERFVRDYSPRLSRAFRHRIAAYEASSYLEHANYCVLMGKFDSADFEHWLHEAAECLGTLA